jgi:multiple sugar transport system substrate-binding protein
MKLRRITAWLVALLLILPVLAGCGLLDQKDDQEEEPYRYIYFYYPRDGSQVLKRLILAYNNTQEQLHQQLKTQSPEDSNIPKPIRVEGLEGSGERTAFFEKLDELTNGDETVPDIILVHDTWLMKMVAEDRILPLDGGLSNSKKNEFFDGMNHAMIYNNKTYGVPFWQDIPLLYYRKDLVESPPASWSELALLANRVSEAQEIEHGIVFPGASQENNAVFLGSLWSYYGATPDFSEKEINFNEDAMSRAWEPIISMAESGALVSDVTGMSAEDCRGVFESGKAVFMWNWSYASRLFQREESLMSGKVSISPLPVSDQGGLAISGYALTMSKNSSDIPETWNFIQYLVSDESQRELRDSGLLPAKKSLYQPGWLTSNGLPGDLSAMMDTGETINLGSHVEAALTMMSEATYMAVGQNKSANDLIKFIREGIVTEESEEAESPDEELTEGESSGIDDGELDQNESDNDEEDLE